MRKLSAALLAALALSGCQDAPITGIIDPDFVGKYALTTVSDSPVPYTLIASPSYTLVLVADTISLDASGGFSDIKHYNRQLNGVSDTPVTTTSGSWRTNGAAFKATLTTGEVYQGIIIDLVKLNLTGGGLTSVYQKF